jgi:predicted CoA-substrate-specific enzyme activase
MIFAGVDVGAATAKAVILKDEEIQGYSIMPTGYDVRLAAEKVIKEALVKAGLSISIDDLTYVVSTGYGRDAVSYADKAVTEIICHAKGAHFLIPSTRTIFDIGGQDSKAIAVEENGNVVDFVMNDKCAAGTGRFLEVMAGALEVGSVDKMGPISLESKDPCKISSTCTIFAETEVISLRAQGRSREDLIAGVHRSVASRVAIIGSRIAWERDVIFTGGVAKNIGVKQALAKEIGLDILVPDEPQIIGALGAALIARERYSTQD